MTSAQHEYSAQHVPARIKKLHPDVQLPVYKRPGDAGMDIFSREDFMLVPGEQHVFMTGWSLALPPGFVSLIWDRSGMAAKNGIKVMGGVIEHSYRGEYGVVLINLTKAPYEVKRGDRIAQLLIQPICTAALEEVDELDETHRGDGAWGSSGR
jgi:dUTP pyrophosphatase